MINYTQPQVRTVIVDFGSHLARHEPNIGFATDLEC